jgi:hypothetical protein
MPDRLDGIHDAASPTTEGIQLLDVLSLSTILPAYRDIPLGIRTDGDVRNELERANPDRYENTLIFPARNWRRFQYVCDECFV